MIVTLKRGKKGRTIRIRAENEKDGKTLAEFLKARGAGASTPQNDKQSGAMAPHSKGAT